MPTCVMALFVTPRAITNRANNNLNIDFHFNWQVVKCQWTDIDCEVGQLSAVV